MSPAGRGSKPSLGHAGTDDLSPLLRRVAAAPEVELPVSIEPGRVIDDTYRIIDRLGSGGMGVVYRARDESLDRDVAIKLHVRLGSEGMRRLQREARAMARLAHPNVVAIHEVGSCTIDDRECVFIVMEYVPGASARTWLERETRTWRDVLEIYLQAGEGLAAAHGVGLVHRDFKPDNVLIGRDGRVRVADFGLARALEAGDHDTAPPSPTDDADALTLTDGVAGTPAYMAPEQRRGRADARSDQYAFCVALYEGLCGRRPLRDSTIITGDARSPGPDHLPPPTSVPRGVRRALERALHPDPDRRHPGMHELLAALRRALAPPRWRRRTALAVALAIAGTGGGLLTARGVGTDEPSPCAHARGALDELWNGERRAALQDAFASSGAPGAAEAWKHTERALDRYTGRWLDAREQACVDTRVRARHTTEQLTRRVACLDRGRRELAALLALLPGADADLVGRAARAADALPEIAHCADPGYLGGSLAAPADPSVIDAVADVRTELAEAAANRHAARYERAAAIARRQVERGAELGHEPVVAEAQLELALAEAALDRHDEAGDALAEAYFGARASAHDTLAARASTELGRLFAYDLARFDDAERWLRHAEADVRRVAPGTDLEARLASSRGLLYEQQSRLDDAVREQRRAVKLYRSIGASPLRLADARMRLGTALDRLGRPDEAIALYRETLAAQRAALGDDHPDLIPALDNLGLTLSATGKPHQAIRAHERALAIARRHLGPAHTKTAYALLNLGVAHHMADRFDRAIELYARSLAIIEDRLGPEHPDAALVHNSLGVAHAAEGAYAEARPHYRRALAIQRAALGDDHLDVAIARANLAEIHVETDRPADALPLLERAVATWNETAPDNPGAAYALTSLGEAHLSLGRPALAIPPLERALALREAHDVDAQERAITRFALARALRAAGRTPDRARALADEARPDLSGSQAADLDRWKNGAAP